MVVFSALGLLHPVKDEISPADVKVIELLNPGLMDGLVVHVVLNYVGISGYGNKIPEFLMAEKILNCFTTG
jgi:hypothetical protein